MQWIIFVLGAFHLKMACADALWRIFLRSGAGKLEKTSLFSDISIVRPNETGIMSTKPGFRRMHQTIQDVGICRRLDLWRVEATKRKPEHANLEEFAASKPSLSQLVQMANHIVRNYVADSPQLYEARRHPTADRDKQYENSLLLNQYFLLYEELTFAMNHGDIKRFESCFLPWICIFKAVGKHKYARYMQKHLLNVHFVYPEGLK